jgi:hypothetical protein
MFLLAVATDNAAWPQLLETSRILFAGGTGCCPSTSGNLLFRVAEKEESVKLMFKRSPNEYPARERSDEQ